MFRRYNRWWSRFDQPDPFAGSYELIDPQSFNRYAYVQNDPVNSSIRAGWKRCPLVHARETILAKCGFWGGGGADDPRFYPSTGGPAEVGGVIIPREPLPRGGGQDPQNPREPLNLGDLGTVTVLHKSLRGKPRFGQRVSLAIQWDKPVMNVRHWRSWAINRKID
jgi:hypothetical protein